MEFVENHLPIFAGRDGRDDNSQRILDLGILSKLHGIFDLGQHSTEFPVHPTSS